MIKLSEAQKEPLASAKTADAVYGHVTVRAILLSLFLSVLNDYWLVQLEVVRYSFATYAAPFYNCIFTLLVVTGANFLTKRIFPRFALSRIELLTIYIMVSISSAVCSTNMMQILVSLMGYAFFFKSPENKWEQTFLDKIPRWLTVSDQSALRNYYYGNSSLYDPTNYTPWIIPALWWSAFCAVLISTMLCINTIFRKQWVESERLTFPIIMLPLEMTEDSGSLFKNKYMWLGFAIAGTITLVAGLNYLYPSMPYIRIVRRDIGQYFTTPPWNAMGGIPMGFYFWAIGVAFLMPLELSFSCWLFYWLFKLELVMCAAFGWNQLQVTGGGFDSSYPFTTSQAYGGYLGFFAMSMWTSRKYLGRVFRTAFKGTKEEDESREPISYRSAILGALAGIIFLCGFGRIMIGMSLWVVAVFFIFYFIFAIIVSRIRAELGFPTHDMHTIGPQHLIETTAGTKDLGTQNLVGFSLFFWFNRTYASHPSPHQAEAYKISERTGTPARQIFIASIIAAIFAMPIGFWMLLHNYYKLGGATAHMEMWAMGFGIDTWNGLDTWIKQPLPPNKISMLFIGVGFTISMFLSWMRLCFLWFPFHPLAYAIANSWGVAQLWMPLIIGSTFKFLILRFGGLSSYRKALPFFFGLILGEIAIGSMWTLIGIILGIPTYDFWPGKYG